MASNTVWGLDIGNSAIKAVKMQRSGNDCSIVEFDIIDIPGGDDPAERPVRLQEAMKNLTDTHKFGGDPVFLGVPGSVCLHREFTLPPVQNDAKLHEMVQFEARQQIPFPLDQVEWGYERFQSEDSNAVNVTLIAVRKSDIQELVNICDNFNLKLAGIVAVPMALFNFIHYEFKPSTTTLILDSGSKGTDFVVMNKRQIYFRNIQIAGRELTRVLENKFKVPFEKAENIKKNISQSPQMDQILTVIEPTLRNLGADIQRTIGFYKSRSKGQKIAQAYLLGHTFRLPKMAEFLLTQIREAPFAIVEGLQRIRLAPSVPRDVWENEFPTMAVAIGLGLQGLGLSELTLNLIPQAEKAQTIREIWKKWAAASAVALLISLGVVYFMAKSSVREYETARERAKKVLDEVEEASKAEKKAAEPIQAKKFIAERLARLGRDRGKIEEIYNKILNIRTAGGQPFFGRDTHMFVAGLYVSRAPWVTELRNEKIRDKVPGSEGFKRLYEKLKEGPEPLEVAPELRPDAPLLVVISGEAQIIDNQPGPVSTNIQNLQEALKALPTTKLMEVIVNPTETTTHTDEVPKYNNKGKRADIQETPNDQPPEAVESVKKDVLFIPFHIMLVWDDPEDPDRAPISNTAAAPTTPAAPK